MRYLTVCRFGKNRSRYLAGLLQEAGASVRYIGVQCERSEVQSKIDEADVLIVVRPNIAQELADQFHIDPGKKVIVLDVDDRSEYVHPDKKPLDGDDWITFQNTVVYPELKRQMQEKLKEANLLP